jgi:hypothetical protein
VFMEASSSWLLASSHADRIPAWRSRQVEYCTKGFCVSPGPNLENPD